MPGLGASEAIPGWDVIATVGIAGILVYMAVQGLTSHSVNQADQQTDQGLKEGDQAEPCIECGEMPCFEPPEGGDRDEMARQLQEQQDLINSQSPDEMQQRLDAAQARKDTTGSYRPDGDSAARSQTRGTYQQTQTDEQAAELEAQGMSPAEAQAQASSNVAGQMKSLDATHQLDSIVGGNEADALGMGDRSINRSLGSQWKFASRRPGKSGEGGEGQRAGRDGCNVEGVR